MILFFEASLVFIIDETTFFPLPLSKSSESEQYITKQIRPTLTIYSHQICDRLYFEMGHFIDILKFFRYFAIKVQVSTQKSTKDRHSTTGYAPDGSRQQLDLLRSTIG
jgi:hypothetical protein